MFYLRYTVQQSCACNRNIKRREKQKFTDSIKKEKRRKRIGENIRKNFRFKVSTDYQWRSMTFFGWLLSFCGEGKGWKKNDWTFLANLRCNVCHKSANWRCRTNWNSSRYMEIERATFISRNAYFFLREEDLQMFSVETEYFLWIFSWWNDVRCDV